MTMTQEYDDQHVDRRRFLKAAALTAVAATATGAGAALINKQAPTPATITTVSSPPMISAPPPLPAASNDAAELWAKLAESQAENVRLQASLSATQSQVTSLQQQVEGKGPANEHLTMELANANQQISLLGGLVALFEQLDEVDVEGVLAEGFTAVSETITNWIDDIPTLDEGLVMGRQALDELEEHIPLLENGRIWLDSQVSKTQVYYQAIELLLQTAVEAIGPFLDMLNDWFQKVRRWLPFNMGEQAAEIMQSITNLLSETPHTITGLNTNIAQPLDVWLSRETGETPLQQNLVKPIRHNVFDKTSASIAKAQTLQTVYQTQLAEPTQTAVTSQRPIKDLIVAYREQHQI
jgi:hypothetical protein